MPDTILDVRRIQKWFPVKQGLLSRVNRYVKAVDDVSFTMQSGEILGLVGESGCGKSTLARVILQLLRPTGGQVFFRGENLNPSFGGRNKDLRKRMQIVFQDPYSSLNPRMTVGEILSEALRTHHIVQSKQLEERVALLLETVGLNAFHAKRFPHEFSSGQKQRIGVARALSVQPEFIVCDEPVSALDVSIQAQILNLLLDLKRRYQLTYLFISHDLSVIRHVSERIAVMYLGKIVELGTTKQLTSDPAHPYTKALLSAAPIPDPKRIPERTVLKGDVPNPSQVPSGCPFHPRCPEAFEECKRIVPDFAKRPDGRYVTCLLFNESWPEGQGNPAYKSA
ncbi:MAG: hypothetical protein CL946_08850 [Ectothiorhodospiraceae bacterium]|nr:hypothetical protein [Ectothiorhodospiraceae bacterium]